MRGVRKTKRVSWAPDEKLSQVKQYREEDPPSEVGRGARLARIPLIEWKCPPAVFSASSELGVLAATTSLSLGAGLDPLCRRVAVGEQSIEVQVQRLRESRVLEAFYPRASAIPDNPTVAPDAAEPYDDSKTPVIPLSPIYKKDLPSDAPENPAFVNGGYPASVDGGYPAPVDGNGRPESLIYPQPPPMGTNYYCNSLIQHGEERPEEGNYTMPDKSMRPCMFFNTPMGCKRGANCPFQHGSSVAAGRPYKRMKMKKY